MKKILSLLIILIISIGGVFTMTGCGKKPLSVEERNRQRAIQVGNAVFDSYIDQDQYKLKRTDPDWNLLVYNFYNPYEKDSGSGRSSCWHYTAPLALSNRLLNIATDKEAKKHKYAQLNEDFISELAWYRGEGEITSFQNVNKRWHAYAVDRSRRGRNTAAITGIASVYDDQMWLIREFIAAYHSTGKIEYLQEAEYLSALCIDGWDFSINEASGQEFGGITWGPGYRSRHTCSNAPFVSALAELYEIYKNSSDTIDFEYHEGIDASRDSYTKNNTSTKTKVSKKDYYLFWAEKVYNWNYNTLKNADDTFADLIGAEVATRPAGHPDAGLKYTVQFTDIDPKAHTYNAGAMISGAAMLYKATGNDQYRIQGAQIAQGSHEAFAYKTGKQITDADGNVKELKQIICTTTIWFNLVLLQGYIDLYPYVNAVDEYIQVFQESMDYAYDNYYFNGFIPRDFANGFVYGYGADMDKDVMDSASYAEMYGMLYQHEFYKNTKQ